MKVQFLILAVLAVAACGPLRDMETLVGTTKEMKEQTINLNEGMNKTNEAVHLQVLTVALQGLTAKENTEQLTPPARMLPFAHAFATEATAHEIIKEFYTLWTDVKFGSTNTKENPTAADVRLQSRRVALTAGGAIAALTSNEKFEEILKEQVKGQGRFEETAYAFTLCRYTFIRDFMFSSVVNNTRDFNVATLETAVNYFLDMKKIVNLPFIEKMDFTIPAFSEQKDGDTVTMVESQIKLDPAELSGLARTAVRRFKGNMTAEIYKSEKVQNLIKHLR